MPRIVAWVVRLAAVFAVLDVLDPAERPKPLLGPAMDAVVDGTAFATAMCSAGAMLVLAGALQRRKRRAWLLMAVVVSAGAIAHLKAERWSVVAINLAVLALLIWARRDFTASSERATRRAALRVFVVLGTVSFIAGLFLTARTAPGSPISSRLVETFFGLIGFTPDLAFPREYASDVTEFALNSLGALTALLTLVALLRPARKTPTLSAEDEERLRGLLDKFGGRDSLGYFALRGDKTAIFSPSGKAAVVYRVIGSVTMASGDPLGDPEAWPQAIDAWLAEAHDYAWTPGVLGASEAAAIVYRRAGLDSLEMGDEAVLDLDDFSLEGRSMRVVRQAVNRVKRAGYTLDVRRQKELSTDELVEVITTSDALREQDVERGFSMALGRLGDSRDPELMIARARDADGRLVALLTFVPWGADGLSLDLMRRAQGSENGTVEFLVTGVAEAVKGMGIARISLNFAVFRSVFERGSRVGAGPVLRLWHKCLIFASRWWQIESLYRANVKYNPVWSPRFVCFRKVGELPHVVIAGAEAEAFIQRPRLRWLAP